MLLSDTPYTFFGFFRLKIRRPTQKTSSDALAWRTASGKSASSTPGQSTEAATWPIRKTSKSREPQKPSKTERAKTNEGRIKLWPRRRTYLSREIISYSTIQFFFSFLFFWRGRRSSSFFFPAKLFLFFLPRPTQCGEANRRGQLWRRMAPYCRHSRLWAIERDPKRSRRRIRPSHQISRAQKNVRIKTATLRRRSALPHLAFGNHTLGY